MCAIFSGAQGGRRVSNDVAHYLLAEIDACVTTLERWRHAAIQLIANESASGPSPTTVTSHRRFQQQ
uniref:Uncharacterized protein n=1 Tax=Plectus sambesii TaxID=2011161 RepID=A0A914WUD3_9BILA